MKMKSEVASANILSNTFIWFLQYLNNFITSYALIQENYSTFWSKLPPTRWTNWCRTPGMPGENREWSVSYIHGLENWVTILMSTFWCPVSLFVVLTMSSMATVVKRKIKIVKVKVKVARKEKDWSGNWSEKKISRPVSTFGNSLSSQIYQNGQEEASCYRIPRSDLENAMGYFMQTHPKRRGKRYPVFGPLCISSRYHK